MGERFPQWLMDSTAAIERMPKPKLVELVGKADPDAALEGLTSAQLVDLLKRRRKAHWNSASSDTTRDAPPVAARVVRVGDRRYIIPPSVISAGEANDFLRSLPRLDPDEPLSGARW